MPYLVLPPGALRLLLALAVVVSHSSGFDIGRLAVLLFFYLSGYWTARIWAEKFDGANALRFYASRALRILPLYLLVMVVAAFVRGQTVHPENLALLGVASMGRDPTGVAWSLDIELQFYLLLPLVAAVTAATRRSVLIAGSLAIGALGCWIEAAWGLTTVAKFLPAFLLGSMTFAFDWRPGERAARLSLAAFLAFTAATALTPFLTKGTPDPFDHDIYGFVWMLPLLPYVAHSLTVRSSGFDRHLGNLSYPLYLIHYPVIVALSLPKPVELLMAMALSVVVYLTFDRPVDGWRLRLLERRPKPVAVNA